MSLSAKNREIKLPAAHDWRTSDTDEINKRRVRAREETFAISNQNPKHPVFSNFSVKSGSGMTYAVEVRDVRGRQFSCSCVDFRTNSLGTCKHVEAVLLHLEARFRRLFKAAQQSGTARIDVIVDSAVDTLRVIPANGETKSSLRKWFNPDGMLAGHSPEDVVTALSRIRDTTLPSLRISQDVASWLENRRRAEERKQLRHEYEMKVQSGEWPLHETKSPLFPYQRDGMLHLAFTERALLADEMGLGKTIQAIAACALLHRVGRAQRVLVVTPASLKTEWEEQIQRFTDLTHRLVFGARAERLKAYSAGESFFTVVNYEQMVVDGLEVNERLRPDIVVLDEAQRIKNWSTKTAQAVKRLRSRYAFVLTGTPIENRIDELHSLMDFLNPAVLGPLFRFNRDFYEFDDRGRPAAYRNLGQLNARVRPYMLRRRKADVETELPERTDRNHFVQLTPLQKGNYAEHEANVARLMQAAQRRPLTPREQDKLMRELAMMRMTCDTNYILDQEDRECPKLAELEKILDECRENDAKVIVFSEWERMLELVRERCREMKIGFAWHTGSVPQMRRRGEINAFKTDPRCRVFLSTDSGATGLNLQNASVVINCDLPWNPAKLEQRIARAWRKHQTKPVTVINLISENTIEHKMLDTLAGKQALADGVLDLKGDLNAIPLRGGKQAMLARLEQLISRTGVAQSASPQSAILPADRPMAFTQRLRQKVNGALVRCEERYPTNGSHTVLFVVVENNAAQHQNQIVTLHEELFGPDKTDPLAPVQLQVVDRATDEAIQRMIAAGLLLPAIRSQRPLFPDACVSEPPALTVEERAKAAAHRSLAERKLKVARLLGDGGMADEARGPLLDAILGVARAFAVENRMPEPAEVKDAVLPPLSHLWEDRLPFVRGYVTDPSTVWQPAAEALQRIGRFG